MSSKRLSFGSRRVLIMILDDTTVRTGKTLTWLLALYGLASLVHFVHNAEYLVAYPNLPAWLSRFQIYGAWGGITAVGLAGYTQYRRGRPFIGLSFLALYAALGFDALLHYRRAPLSAHTVSMNLTIWLEVGTAALALLAVIRVAAKMVTLNGRHNKRVQPAAAPPHVSRHS